MDPARFTPAELAATLYTPQQLIGLNGADREAIAAVSPANMLDPRVITVPAHIGGPDINPFAGGIEAAGTIAGTEVGGQIFDAVLGPIAEVAFGFVMAAAGLALVVLALAKLSKDSGVTDAAVTVAKTAAVAAA